MNLLGQKLARRLLGLILVCLALFSIGQSVGEDLEGIRGISEHSVIDWDGHPCHSHGDDDVHICHVGHCAVTSLDKLQAAIDVKEYEGDYTQYHRRIIPDPFIHNLLRPPIS